MDEFLKDIMPDWNNPLAREYYYDGKGNASFRKRMRQMEECEADYCSEREEDE